MLSKQLDLKYLSYKLVSMEECSICGKEFDSSRGLNIHKSQVHKGEEQETETENVSEPEAQDSYNVSVSVQQALVVVFTLGLAVGFSAGMVASGFNGQLLAEDTNPVADNDDNSQVSGESTMAAIEDIANSVGADGEQIASCTESADTEEIDQDKSEINRIAGGMGTPNFFIGNSEVGYTQVNGAQPYSRMKSTIDEKIQQAEGENSSIGEDEYTLEEIGFEGEPVIGEESAPINIIEYSDYQCPWCAEWHGVNAIPQRPIDEEDSFNKVRSNYVETGDVQFVLKDYPVPNLHPDAETAHKAANCVLENSPDNFWEFSEKLYEERDKWSN